MAYPVSISLWIKTSDTTAVFRDPFAGGNAGLHNNFLALQLNTTQKLILNAKHDGSNGTITSALNYNDGIWHHVVGLWRSTIDRELYADGISIGTSAVDIGGFPTLDTAYIGAININGSIIQHFPGIIDDVRIYNRALTPNEIGRLYDVGH